MQSNLMVFVFIATMALIGLCSAQAPGDEAGRCNRSPYTHSYPSNVKILMDSWNYQQLLQGSGSGSSPITSAVWDDASCDDNDDNTITSPTYWQHGGGGVCRFQSQVCGIRTGDQDNWLFTQHISKAFPEGSTCPSDGNVHVFVNVTYSFRNCRERSNCNPRFKIHKYVTGSKQSMNCDNTRDLFSGSDIMPNNVFGPVSNGIVVTHQRYFNMSTSQDGFHLALQDYSMDTSRYHLRGTCVGISRLLVYRHQCPAKKIGLVSFPATPAQVNGDCPTEAKCVENAHSISSLRITCDSDGNWGNENPQCECDDGYMENNGRCEACPAGTYFSSGACENCPANTVTTEEATNLCECTSGYFRNTKISDNTCISLLTPSIENAVSGCTAPPSSPNDVTVSAISATQLRVTWSRPTQTGGRSDLYYVVEHSDPDHLGEFIGTTCKSSSTTSHTFSNMRAGTQYCVRVSAHNGVSDQDPDGAPTRFTEECARLLEAAPGAIAGVISSYPIVVWNQPERPNGVITNYRLTFRRGGSTRTTDTNSDQTYYVIQSGDVPGTSGDFTVTIRARNSAGLGSASTAITTSPDSECPTTQSTTPPPTTTPPTECPTSATNPPIQSPGPAEGVVALGCGIVGWRQPNNTGGEIMDYVVRFFDGNTYDTSGRSYREIQRGIGPGQTWARAQRLPSTRPIYADIRVRNSVGVSVFTAKVIVASDSLCACQSTEAPTTEAPTCPSCPTCPPPTTCPTCPPPITCPTCPACPTCPPTTTCPPPVTCPACPECPSATTSPPAGSTQPGVAEGVQALACGVVGWRPPADKGPGIMDFVVRFFNGESFTSGSSYREIQRGISPEQTWARAKRLPDTRPIYCDIRVRSASNIVSSFTEKIIVANNTLCTP